MTGSATSRVVRSGEHNVDRLTVLDKVSAWLMRLVF